MSVLRLTDPPVSIELKLYIISLEVVFVTNRNWSRSHLPCILIVPTPVGTSVGNPLRPLVIVSTVLNASVLIFALGPVVTPFDVALSNECNDVSEDIPTFMVTVVPVTDAIVNGA